MSPVRFVLVRLAIAAPTMLVVATLTFGLLKLTPGSPAQFMRSLRR